MKDSVHRWCPPSVNRFTSINKLLSGNKVKTSSSNKNGSQELREFKVKRRYREYSTRNLARCVSIVTLLLSLYVPGFVESSFTEFWRIQQRVPKSAFLMFGFVASLLCVLFFKILFFGTSFLLCSILMYGLVQQLIPLTAQSFMSFKLLECISGLFASYLVFRLWWQLLASYGALVGMLIGMFITLTNQRLIASRRKIRLIIISLSGCAGVSFVYFLDNILEVVVLATYNIEQQFNGILKISIILGFEVIKELCNAILTVLGQWTRGMGALNIYLNVTFSHLTNRIQSVYYVLLTVLDWLLFSGQLIYGSASLMLCPIQYLFDQLAILIIHLVVIYLAVLTD